VSRRAKKARNDLIGLTGGNVARRDEGCARVVTHYMTTAYVRTVRVADTAELCTDRAIRNGEVRRLKRWYALHTRARHEKRVDERLRKKKFETFLPLVERTRVRRGRRYTSLLPLFPNYLFVRAERDRVLKAYWTKGVLRVLGADESNPTPVPEAQIERIKIALENEIKLDPHPYLKEGQRVRVKYGPLAGVEGILVKKKQHLRLVVGIDLISRSAVCEISADDVEPL